MKSDTYYRGVPGKKYGIYNCSARYFQFGIKEDTPMLAMARLHQKLGADAKKHRFEPRMLPDRDPKPSGTVSDRAKQALQRMGSNAHGGQDDENENPWKQLNDAFSGLCDKK